jgi:hypothetical protein
MLLATGKSCSIYQLLRETYNVDNACSVVNSHYNYRVETGSDFYVAL